MGNSDSLPRQNTLTPQTGWCRPKFFLIFFLPVIFFIAGAIFGNHFAANSIILYPLAVYKDYQNNGGIFRRHLISYDTSLSATQQPEVYQSLGGLCPQVEPILPIWSTTDLDAALEDLRSEGYFKYSAKVLGEAIRIRTDVNDKAGEVGEDKLWEKMEAFIAWLKLTFPRVHANLQLDRINTYGLLYTWVGSDSSLKPVALAGHYDTVGVAPETIDQWVYPPYSGHLDLDGKLWGRGSVDDKGQVVAAIEAIELLLKANFKPNRTVILTFGFDEELGGRRGAQNLGLELYARYGRSGVALVIDEGTSVFEQFGSTFIVISTAEKGNSNQKIVVRTPGGHASLPPPHTGVGIMADLITKIEDHPYPIFLADDNPLYNFLTCAAAHAEEFPKDLKRYIKRGNKQRLAKEIAKMIPRYAADLRTTMAVTMIEGGLKVNALPQSVTTYIDHRIRRGSSVAEIMQSTEKRAASIAKKYGLQLFPYPENATYPLNSITLEMEGTRQTSPLTSSRVDISTPFKLIAGTSRAVFGEEFIISPGLNAGNTDTVWYWNSTDNIFRYAPMPTQRLNLHGINECVEMKAHVAMVEWFFTFLRNADESEFEI
ncbi:hypothetical protein ABW20_dc0102048 [Dactylellina cionopaga]|nr:hypothetical protein ABW20_dc0102048 [Dactylellina cionopaga]